MLVSFIIPSYNSAHTVKRCLDSIYALSLKQEEFEVIFIDDCSTDNTCEIVEAYSQPLQEGKGVNNLTLLKQPKNNRQGAARNRGVSVTKGEYICFVDSDDAVSEGIVDAVRLAKEKQADMVAFHFAHANEQEVITSESPKLTFVKQEIFTGVEMQNEHSYWCSAPWGYIYQTAFLQKVNYPFAEGALYEDSDFVAVHLYYAQRIAYSPELGYIAYYREGSTTHSTSYKNTADYFLLGVRMLRFFEHIVKEEEVRGKSEEVETFAEGILEGACWNVSKSCRRLIKLSSINEVHLFYERVDAVTDRKRICVDKRLRKYFWSIWTSICIGHKQFTITLLTFMIPIYRIIKKK